MKRTITAVAVALSVGGATFADRTANDIPLQCDPNAPAIEALDEKLRTYEIDEGFLKTRPMTAEDRATIKGCEIAKAVGTAMTEKDGLVIEVIEVEPIEGGVQV